MDWKEAGPGPYPSFESVAHVGIAEEKLVKSDTQKTWKGIFIGYSLDTSKHYRVWAPQAQRVFVADNPTIDESEQGAKMLKNWPIVTLPNSIPAKRKATAGEPRPRGRPRKNLVVAPISKNDKITDDVNINKSTNSSNPTDLVSIPLLSSSTTEQAMSTTETSSKVCEPTTYDKAVLDPIHGRKWREAIEEEIDNLDSHNTWQYEELPPDRKPIRSKWCSKSSITQMVGLQDIKPDW